MRNKLAVFPALVSFDGNSYHVDFINLKGCSAVANDIQTACSLAQKKMILFLQKHPNVPEPTFDFSFVSLEKDEHIIFISANISVPRDTRAVKKTLTIPSWLNDMAMEEKINFSHVLQKALKRELCIDD